MAHLQEIENQAYALGAKLEREKRSEIEIEDTICIKGFPKESAAQVAKDMIIERNRRNRETGKSMVMKGSLAIILGGIASVIIWDFGFIASMPIAAIFVGLIYLLAGIWKLTA